MSAFQVIHEVSITTPIPTGMDPSKVITALHDHKGLFTMNPHVTGFERIEPTESMINDFEIAFAGAGPGGVITAYNVHQNVPLYGSTTLLAIFSNQPDGVDSIADAPLGLRLSNKWRVVPDDFDTQRMVLREDCKIHSSMLLLPLMSTVIVPEWKKAHHTTHAKLLAKITSDSPSSERLTLEGKND